MILSAMITIGALKSVYRRSILAKLINAEHACYKSRCVQLTTLSRFIFPQTFLRKFSLLEQQTRRSLLTEATQMLCLETGRCGQTWFREAIKKGLFWEEVPNL